MYPRVACQGNTAQQWRERAFVVPPVPPKSQQSQEQKSQGRSRLSSPVSGREDHRELKSSVSGNTGTCLHAVPLPRASATPASSRPYSRTSVRRTRPRARWQASRAGGGATSAGGNVRKRGSPLSSAAPQTLADPAVRIRRKVDELEAAAARHDIGKVAAGGVDIGVDPDLFGDVQQEGDHGGVLRTQVQAVSVTQIQIEFDQEGRSDLGTDESIAEEDSNLTSARELAEKEDQRRSRLLITKLTELARSGEWERALEVFRMQQTAAMHKKKAAQERGEEEVPSVLVEAMAYNATLAALSKGGRWKEANMLMREMKTRGITRDTISFASAIAACGRGKQWKKALEFLSEMRSEGVPANSHVYCSAIDACAKGGQWRRAIALLQEMETVDSLAPNVNCMNSAIDACGKARRQGEALAVLSRMRRVGIQPNEVSYLSAISACSRVGDWEEALNLLDRMFQDGIKPDIKCYCSAIAACGNGGRWIQAVSLLEEMRTAGIPPNVVCYNAAISACGKGKQWRRAVELLDIMPRKGVARDLISYNSAIDACGKSGRWREGLDIFDDMARMAECPPDPERLAAVPPVPDSTTYGAAITACSKGKQWWLALQLLEDMEEKGVERTEAVYHATLAACAKMGRWRECIVTLDQMRHSGHTPKVVAYNSVITACGRGHQWQRALAVLQQMSSRGATPDTITFNAAMAACAQSRQWEQARDILEFMRNPTSAGSSRFEGLALPISASEYELDTAPSSFNTDRDSLRDEPISRRPSPGGGSRRSSGGWGKGNDWPPRPDAVSFHVVVKALVAADEWEDAVYVLEEMREERQRILRSYHADVTHGGSDTLWALDMERFRTIFRVERREQVILESEGKADGEMSWRSKAMQVLADIEQEEKGAGKRRQIAYRNIAQA